jgi:quinol monooxygenase YgiN
MFGTAVAGVVLINVFTVERGNQQRLVDLLVGATDGFVDRAPGFISAALHRSLDGTKVTMYAQWLSKEHYQAMRRDPGLDATFEAALKLTAAGIAGEVTALTIVLHAPVSPSKLTSCRMENAGMVDINRGRISGVIAGGAMMMPRRSERRRGKGRNSR